MIHLSGKGALLIGAKRIGQVIGHRLAQEGVNLAIAYRHSRQEAETLHQTVARLTDRTILIQGDVSQEKDVRRIIQTSRRELGDLSFIVNLASNFPKTPLTTLDVHAWDVGMSEAKGTYLVALHGAREMLHNPGPTRGHLIFFTDWAARETPYRDYLPYLTAKSAIDFMTRGFAVELAEHGILVNAIAPGPTQRPPEMPPDAWQQHIIAQTPLQRESSAEEIAELIVTLLKSETITGETIRVDSGSYVVGPERT